MGLPRANCLDGRNRVSTVVVSLKHVESEVDRFSRSGVNDLVDDIVVGLSDFTDALLDPGVLNLFVQFRDFGV